MQHYATVIYLRSLNKHLLLGSKKNQKNPEKLNIAVIEFFWSKKTYQWHLSENLTFQNLLKKIENYYLLKSLEIFTYISRQFY